MACDSMMPPSIIACCHCKGLLQCASLEQVALNLRPLHPHLLADWDSTKQLWMPNIGFKHGGKQTEGNDTCLATGMTTLRVRQRSGEGVVRRNGCPKGCFWRVRFFSAPLRFSGPFRCFKRKPREKLKRAEKKRTLQKHPFGQPFLRTTPSPLFWRTLADTVLASNCHAQFGRPSTRDGMSHLRDGTLAGLARWRDNVLASKCEYPPSVTPLFKSFRPARTTLIMTWSSSFPLPLLYYSNTYVFDIPCAVSTTNVQERQKTSYDSKTG